MFWRRGQRGFPLAHTVDQLVEEGLHDIQYREGSLTSCCLITCIEPSIHHLCLYNTSTTKGTIHGELYSTSCYETMHTNKLVMGFKANTISISLTSLMSWSLILEPVMELVI